MLNSLHKIKERIDDSNKAAAGNRSRYPIQEQVTLIELWEQLDCECAPECFCKKHGCTFHWKIKPNLNADEAINGFVRTYIDVEKHDTFFRCLNENYTPPPRIKEAVAIAKDLKNNWDTYYLNALKSKSCILCDNNASIYWLNRFRALNIDMSIYHFKMLSILLPDIAIPFDVKSRALIKKELGLGQADQYSVMIWRLQGLFQSVIEKTNSKVDDLRVLDEPGVYFDFARQDVRLGKPGYNYAKGFLPLERPFCRVLDKVFYRPDGKDYSGITTLKEHYGINIENVVKERNGTQIRQGENKIFYYDRLKGKANADKLFACFLRKTEDECGVDVPDSFTIEEVVKRIPKEDLGISSSSSYNYALLALFGSQKGRNYFLFEDINIQNIFTQEANNTLRNNYLWKNYLKTRVRINPDYITKDAQES